MTAPASLAVSIDDLWPLVLLVGLCVFAILWADRLKSKWYTRVERKKWERWNGPKAGSRKR